MKNVDRIEVECINYSKCNWELIFYTKHAEAEFLKRE